MSLPNASLKSIPKYFQIDIFFPHRKKKDKQQSRAYGVTRGIDFENVMNVINFDFPHTVESYIHRVGR